MDPIRERLRPPTSEELRRARDVVGRHLAPTPLVGGGGPLLKLETLQPTGAFKVRGALAALDSLPRGARAVSASAGNHALGMVWAAAVLRRPVTVVTPETASPAKLAALDRQQQRAAELVTLLRYGATYEEAEGHARAMAAGTGSTYVSAYSDWAVIAGGASLAAEVDHQLTGARPLTIVVPLGGGGLASGVALWASTQAGVRVVAAGASASPAAAASARAGAVVEVAIRDTIADGLAGNLEDGAPSPAVLAEGLRSGRLTLAEVDEGALGAAVRWLFSERGLVVEGSAAASVAAWMGGATGEGEGTTVLALTGRNITPEGFAAVLRAGCL